MPEDDGAADHLEGRLVPPLFLETTQGELNLAAAAADLLVLYVYPRTGRPGAEPPPGWDETPGARLYAAIVRLQGLGEELRAMDATVVGLSAQTLDEQREAAERLGLPHAVAADPELRVADALRLPTFDFEGKRLQAARPRRRGRAHRRSSIPSSRRTRTPQRCSPGCADASNDVLDRRAGQGERRAGVGIQSRAFRSGAVVPWALPGVGAVASQAFSEKSYGPSDSS